MATSQPQLDPETLRNLAVTLGTLPPQINQQQAPAIAAPGPISMPQGKLSDLSVSLPPAQQPNLKAPRGTLQGDQAERARVESSGPGESQIYGDVTKSGFGQHHPLLGKILGGAGQTLATLGDVGLSAVAPSLAINLPGTAYHHAALLHGLNNQIGEQAKEQQAQAATEAERGRTGLEAAQTEAAREATKELPGRTESEEALQGAETQRNLNPQPATPEMDAYRKLTGMGMSPSDALKEIEKDKQLGLRPPNMAAKTLQLPNGEQVAGKSDAQGNLLLENGQPAPEGTKLYQQPNYGQMVLPTKTATFIGPDGVPREYQWNEATQTYDKPLGISASNAYGHEVAQAGAVGRAGGDLIAQLQDPANREILGKLDSYIKQGTLGTPLADAQAAKLSAELRTFAALQPAMHGFRSRSAQEAFEKIVGGLAQNPDATIGSIQGILETAGAINPEQSRSAQGTGSGLGVSLKKAMALPVNKGKSEADVRKDIEAHGHMVQP